MHPGLSYQLGEARVAEFHAAANKHRRNQVPQAERRVRRYFWRERKVDKQQVCGTAEPAGRARAGVPRSA
jgi:hypothetical protein